MASVDDIRKRLYDSPFVVRDETPAEELRALRDKAAELLDDLTNTPQSLATQPTAKVFAVHTEALLELKQLIRQIDLALAVLNANSPAATHKALFEWLELPLDELSKLEPDRLAESERAILIRAGWEVGLLVSSLSNKSRFFSEFVARQIRSAVSVKTAKKTNAKKTAKRPDYTSAVKTAMASGMKYTPACQKVADDLDATRETIRNNTPELRPRKPKSKPKSK